jgi:hypothetical protein
VVFLIAVVGCSDVHRGEGSQPGSSRVDASAAIGPQLRDAAMNSERAATPRPVVLAPIALASGQKHPAAVAVDHENVYWLNLGTNERLGLRESVWSGGEVMKCTIGGCGEQPSAIASNRTLSPGSVRSLAFATDGQNAYWTDETPLDAGAQSALVKCAVNGCNNSPTAIGPGVQALAVHAGRIYWTEFRALVSSCAASGCDTTQTQLWLAGNTPVVRAIAADDSGVYWSTGAKDSIMKCGLDGCSNSPTVLDPVDPMAADIEAVAVDRDNVYFADGNPAHAGMILSCPKSGCVGTPSVLADGLSSPNSIATDGINVYWAETGDTYDNGRPLTGTGSIRTCACSGCNNAPMTVASGLNYPIGIAVDDEFLYWAEQGTGSADGRIWMAPK